LPEKQKQKAVGILSLHVYMHPAALSE